MNEFVEPRNLKRYKFLFWRFLHDYQDWKIIDCWFLIKPKPTTKMFYFRDIVRSILPRNFIIDKYHNALENYYGEQSTTGW